MKAKAGVFVVCSLLPFSSALVSWFVFTGAEISAWLEEFILVCVHQGRQEPKLFSCPSLFFTSPKYFAFPPSEVYSQVQPLHYCTEGRNARELLEKPRDFSSLRFSDTCQQSLELKMSCWNEPKLHRYTLHNFYVVNRTYVGAVTSWNALNCIGLSWTGCQLGPFFAPVIIKLISILHLTSKKDTEDGVLSARYLLQIH